jgi:5-methylcytosine-specific restriction endonuclease McrA
MLKSCSRCGKIHDFNYRCNVGRSRKYANTEENKLRGRNAWKIKRAQIREDSFNLCAVCLELGVYTYEGLEIHHIKKLREDASGLLEDDNLICLCGRHHEQADRGEIDVEYLRKLVEKRKARRLGI